MIIVYFFIILICWVGLFGQYAWAGTAFGILFLIGIISIIIWAAVSSHVHPSNKTKEDIENDIQYDNDNYLTNERLDNDK
jgi:hypothetical protein